MREQRVIDPTQTLRAHSTDVHSASPHRAGHATGIHPEDRPYLTDGEQQRRRQQPIPRPVQYHYDDGIGTHDEEDDDEVYNTRRASSARRYQLPTTQAPRTIVRYHRQQVPPRGSRTQDYAPPVQEQHASLHTSVPKVKRAQEYGYVHWLVPVGLTMLVVLAVYVGSSRVLNWWHGYQDDLHYGRPRTTQYDVRVGYGDTHTPSHFIAVNLNKQVEIIEFPAGDATKAKVYIGPTLVGDNEDLTPVTLEFRDVNRDGKPDMIVHIGESQTVFLNENGQFRLAKSSDSITL